MKFGFVLFPLLALFFVSGMAADCNCPGNWVIDNKCYCGTEAEKIEKCVRSAAPNWPFSGDKRTEPSSSTSNCPDPVQDPVAFAACVTNNVNDKIVKPLTGAGDIPRSCISSTNAAPADPMAAIPGVSRGPGSPQFTRNGGERNTALVFSGIAISLTIRFVTYILF